MIHGSMEPILIFSQSREKLEQLTYTFIETLKTAALKVIKWKRILIATQVKLLGHISENGISVDLSNIQGIKNLNTPSNITELQVVLGMVTEPMRKVS